MAQKISSRHHCDEILQIVPLFKAGLMAPLAGISEINLNHSFANHKMTIGQIAVHSSAWAVYFLTEPKPWEKVEWTCMKCEYPLTLKFVYSIVNRGIIKMESILNMANDTSLEINTEGNKGPGYIICRLLLHILSHSNQMAYLRQLLDPQWGFGSHFGDMASAFINLDYSTTRDISVPGF